MLILITNRSGLMRSAKGGIAIGVLSIIVAAFFLILLGVFADRLDLTQRDGETDEAIKIRLALKMCLAFYLNLNITNIIASVLLIVGVMKGSHLMMLPWMVNYFFWFLMTVALLIFPADFLTKFILIASAVSLHYVLFGSIHGLYKKFQYDEDLKQKQQELQATLANVEKQPVESKPEINPNFQYQKF